MKKESKNPEKIHNNLLVFFSKNSKDENVTWMSSVSL